MVSYKCWCGYQTGSRKEIRLHAREVHKAKGGAGHSNRDFRGSDISRSYKTVK